MNLNIYIDRDNTKYISVAGEITLNSEVEMLLWQLDDKDYEKINIAFFNANIIHCDLVEKLNIIKKTKKCRIYVFKRYLYSYLYKLGISCEHVENKSLSSRIYPRIRDVDVNNEEVKSFLEKISFKYGYDYSGYQIESIIRRIKICMLQENIRSFKEFQRDVLKDEKVFEDLFHEFSINTTEFFRDPEVFSIIRNKIFPYLNSFNHIKIWCAGCSNGKEAYPLTILLKELGLLNKVQIYATDINPHIIEEAKNGLFLIGDLDTDMQNYKDAGGRENFIDHFDLKGSYIKIKSYLKRNILFFSIILSEAEV